jgi:hypothetical protein
LSSLTILFFVFNKIFISPKSNLKTEIYFPAILFILFIGYFSFHLLFFFCFYFKYITFTKNSISIFELITLKIEEIKFDEIVGFSKSEVYFGRYNWKSKSIVIYFKTGKVSELLNSFVSNLDQLETELKNEKIKYLGFENYNTGWFFRKYKFIEK